MNDAPTLWDAVAALHDELIDKQADAIKSAATARHEDTIQARFEEFYRENPRVYELLIRFARQLRDHGYEHGGMKAIWERMRWEMALITKDPDGFKLNNDFTSRYARRIMAQEPDLDGFFRTRELRAE